SLCRFSLFLFFLLRQPVPLEFAEVGEGFQVSHAIEIDVAHEMVEFVLNDSRKKVFGNELELFAIAIQRLDTKFSPAWNSASKIRNAEAALPIFHELLVQNRHGWIHQNSHRNIAARAVAFDDGNRERFMNLWRR